MLSKKTLSLLLLGALTWLLLVSSPTNAAPTGTSSIDLSPRASATSKTPKPSATIAVPSGTSKPSASSQPKPEKPELPKSKDDLEKDYFTKAPKENKSCFFTGMDVEGIGKNPKQNTALAKQKCHEAKLTTLDDIWKNKNLLNRGEWKSPSNEDWAKFFVWVSEIFAEKSSGTAYLLIADDVKPRKESIFFANEFKEIKAAKKVKKIMRLTFKKDGIENPADATRVWWKEGDKDPETREAIKCESPEECF